MELEFDDFKLFSQYGTLVIEVEPILKQGSYTAHNEAGELCNIIMGEVVDYETLSATFYPETNEYETDCTETLEKLIDKQIIINKITERY